MNAIGLQVERLLSEAAIGGVETMPPVDAWQQYGPAGILLAAFAGAIAILFRWASPLVADWIRSRIALTDAVRKSLEETSAANALRWELVEQNQRAILEVSRLMWDRMHRYCGKEDSDPDFPAPTEGSGE
jgi:hypothetical protein